VRRSLPLVLTYHETQLDALGDATRRAILERLLRQPSAVGELAEHFPVSRPAISQHLRVLKEARLVSSDAEGTRRVYRIDPRGFDELRRYFERFWTGALTSFKKKAEERARAERKRS